MRLKIQHATHYAYDAAPSYLVQRLHLTPSDFEGQRTLSWRITAPLRAIAGVLGVGRRRA